MTALPSAVLEHHREQQRLAIRALAQVQSAWLSMDDDFDASWPRVVKRMDFAMSQAQISAARSGAEYVLAALQQQGTKPASSAAIDAGQFVGAWPLGGGEMGSMPDLLYGAVVKARSASVDSLPERLAVGKSWLSTVVPGQIWDSSRQAAGVKIAATKDSGYIRMLQGNACGRCAILAGRFYRYNTGFDRHPSCRCIHVPVSENVRGDWRTDAAEYFDKLPTAAQLSEKYPNLTAAQRRTAGHYSQEDIFTRAGARTIRDGADPTQVMNARAGMSTTNVAQRGKGSRWTASGRLTREKVFGRDLYATSESVTKRGVARKAMGKKPIRLMPESIYEIAESREEAIKLLKAYGYLK